MRFVSFKKGGRPGYGLVNEDGGIADLGARFGTDHPRLVDLIAGFDARRGALEGLASDFSLDDVRLAVPLADAGRIICAGINYDEEGLDPEQRDPHAPPNLFFRVPRSFAAHGEAILRPPESVLLDYEGEIALVVGRQGRRIAEERFLDHVFGFTCANEGTIRDWLHHGRHNVTQGKNWDRTGSMGPWIVTRDAISMERDLFIETRVNGEVRQRGGLDMMIRPMGRLVAYVSTFMTLDPGDIILTGTPPGAGARMRPPRYLKPGDVLEVEVSGIGVLRNPVEDEA